MEDEQGRIAAARQGSSEAFTGLVEAYQARIRGYIARWVRDPATVDDLAQEVFLAAWKGIHAYRGDAPFGIWLAGIARLQTVTHIRSAARRRRLREDVVADAVEGWRLQALEADSDRLADRLAAVEQLRHCLDGLAPDQRALVAAHYVAGRACVDLARERDQEPGAVRMALLRIRQSLRACVERAASDGLTGEPA